LDHSQVQVETRLGENLLNIVGSPIHLSKTVMNLVSNAVESMPQGGTLIIDTENRYIDQPIRGYDTIEEGDYVVCSVSDGGVGISSEDIDRIFEPFYTKKVMGLSGTGLGMAVVWGTVKDHNGYIDVRSTEDKGTTFTLYFPVTREKLPKEIIQASIDKFKGNGELILVVDDVAEQRDIASGMLTKLGYRVATVSSGEQAVRFLEKDRADLLVLDMIMEPGMDGLDTYIKALKIEPRQKAIIASGFSETDRVKEARNLGAGAYVKKPYTMEKLGLAVRRELDKT
jgi:CheY-like chemotaxis protein